MIHRRITNISQLQPALLWGLLWRCFASRNAYPFCQPPTPVFENDIHVLSAHKMVAMLHNRYILVLTDADYIQVVDTEDPSLGKAFVQEIQLPGTPKDAAFDPDDPDGVYFLLKEGKVVKLNTARAHPLTWKIDVEIPFDGYGMAIAFKGGALPLVTVATADVTVEGAMYISPVQVVAKPESEIRFSLINVIGTPSFFAERGYFLEKSPTHVIDKAPLRAGRFDLQVMDERSQTAFAQVLVTGPDLQVQPGVDALVSGDAKLLNAAGGMGPFQWYADQGGLTTAQGKTVRWIAPDIDEPSRRIAITVTDSMGNLAICQMTYPVSRGPTNLGHTSLMRLKPAKLPDGWSGSEFNLSGI